MTEYHFPGYNFLGLGTQAYERFILKKGDRANIPINKLDYAAVHHDTYYMSYDKLIRAYADALFLDELDNINYPMTTKKLAREAIETVMEQHLHSTIIRIYTPYDIIEPYWLKRKTGYKTNKESFLKFIKPNLKKEYYDKYLKIFETIGKLTKEYDKAFKLSGLTFDEKDKIVIPEDYDETNFNDFSKRIEQYQQELNALPEPNNILSGNSINMEDDRLKQIELELIHNIQLSRNPKLTNSQITKNVFDAYVKKVEKEIHGKSDTYAIAKLSDFVELLTGKLTKTNINSMVDIYTKGSMSPLKKAILDDTYAFLVKGGVKLQDLVPNFKNNQYGKQQQWLFDRLTDELKRYKHYDQKNLLHEYEFEGYGFNQALSPKKQRSTAAMAINKDPQIDYQDPNIPDFPGRINIPKEGVGAPVTPSLPQEQKLKQNPSQEPVMETKPALPQPPTKPTILEEPLKVDKPPTKQETKYDTVKTEPAKENPGILSQTYDYFFGSDAATEVDKLAEKFGGLDELEKMATHALGQLGGEAGARVRLKERFGERLGDVDPRPEANQYAPEVNRVRRKFVYRDRKPFFITYGTDLIRESKEKQQADADAFANFSWVPDQGTLDNTVRNQMGIDNRNKDELFNNLPLWLPAVPPAPKELDAATIFEILTPSLSQTMNYQVFKPEQLKNVPPGRIKLYPQRVQGIGPFVNELPQNRLIFPDIVDNQRR